jgi:hypothetical protein
MLERVVVGVGLVFLAKFNAECVLPIIIFASIGVFIIVKRPYKQKLHNFRQISNMAIAMIIEIIYLAYSQTDS